MQKHPDADAFVRAYLEQPTDAVSRLVFADWLEETGAPHNTAWAHFIRLMIEADRHARDSRERRELDRRADSHAPRIRARLTISARLFVGCPEALLQLLPAPNITVRIGHFRPSASAIECVNEEVARSIPVLPLDRSAGALVVVHPVPVTQHSVSTVRHRLSSPVVVVGGDWEEIVGVLNVSYAAAREQAALVEEALADLPEEFETVPGTYPVGSASDFLDDMLRAGQRRQADLVTFIPQGDVVRVYYRTRAGTVEAGRISRADWTHRVFPEVVRRGESTGTDFTVEVVRNGGERAVRIWCSLFSWL
jgi:uncharacterized protein (TIGR02996 family)